ncbi:uncharacterized protein LOC127879988 isoform X4 [Dreissena polymorpha]|uniref:uncharacterized protein LOC127879988 isoform X4 n=1 Tax=Dreissena polymorpha TaxID=45954 RepID=UPI002263EF13|nr:uncharacterized protein LOC127879988 isoform X4 [Dreissena polymorpha]
MLRSRKGSRINDAFRTLPTATERARTLKVILAWRRQTHHKDRIRFSKRNKRFKNTANFQQQTSLFKRTKTSTRLINPQCTTQKKWPRILFQEAIAFSKLYTETGAAVHPKSECVIKPIHTLPQSARHYKAPPGLASLTSIDWFDRGSKFTRDKIISVLINAKVTREQNEATDKTRREFAFMHYASRVMPGTSQSVHPDKGSPKY